MYLFYAKGLKDFCLDLPCFEAIEFYAACNVLASD